MTYYYYSTSKVQVLEAALHVLSPCMIQSKRTRSQTPPITKRSTNSSPLPRHSNSYPPLLILGFLHPQLMPIIIHLGAYWERSVMNTWERGFPCLSRGRSTDTIGANARKWWRMSCSSSSLLSNPSTH